MDYLSPFVQEACAESDVIIVQRNLFEKSVWDACDYWRGLGKTVAADLDDAYNMMPVNNPAYWFWVANRSGLPQDPVEGLREGLGHVDALFSPSKLILKDWEDVVPGLWLPNFAEGAWYENLLQGDNKGKVIIGYGCSVSHYDSWWGAGIREAAKAVCDRFPQVIWRIHGNDPRIHDQLPVPASQKEWVKGVPPQEWPKQVALFDIGVAPLSGEYDQRRSWIKALEFMLAGVPWVASGGTPYEELAEYGTLVKDDAESWTTALSGVVEHLGERQKRARELRGKAGDLTVDRNINFMLQVFRKAMALRASKPRLPGVIYVNWPNGP